MVIFLISFQWCHQIQGEVLQMNLTWVLKLRAKLGVLVTGGQGLGEKGDKQTQRQKECVSECNFVKVSISFI